MDLVQFYSLMESFGITDRNFLNPLYSQLIEADGFGGEGVEFAVAVIKSINPRDSHWTRMGRPAITFTSLPRSPFPKGTKSKRNGKSAA